MAAWIESHRSMVQPQDCDFNNHMNVECYYSRFCNAGGYFLGLAGIYHGQVLNLGLGIGTISNTVRYFNELVHADQLIVMSAVFRLGASSIHYGHRMLNAKTKALSATATFSEVLFDLETRQSTPWTDDMRLRIAPLTVALDDEEKTQFAAVYP